MRPAEPSPPELVVIGENVIDLLPTSHGPDVFRAVPGGGPANVAVAARRLGLPVTLLARVGDDSMGRLVRERLEREGLDPRGLVPAGEPTALAVASVGPTGAAQYDFRLDDAADWRWRAGELPDVLDAGVRALHTGSIAAFRQPGAALIEDLMRRERARGAVTISFDPNIRPDVIGDPEPARAAVRRLAGLAHVVKASDEDLAFLAPGTAPVDAARELAELGPDLVVVTLGGDGAVAVTAGTEARVPAPTVRVVDTVGAGDSFMGALLHWLRGADLLGSAPHERLRGLDEARLRAALGHACAAAAHTITREGTDPPTAADLAAAGAGSGDDQGDTVGTIG